LGYKNTISDRLHKKT